MLVTERPLLGQLRRKTRLDRIHSPRALSWLFYFMAIGTVLVVRNGYLFTTKIYEDSDFAANTIAVLQAKHFHLLTGNYSRVGFYHPGPFFLYIEAWGEWLFRDVTHLLPTPWNGQLLAILLLNAGLLAAVISILARQGGRAVAVGCLATVLGFSVLHPLTINSNWMPYVYFAPALLLLVSAAAVAAGQTTSVPLLFLSAGLCVHGQAEFLFFAPIVVLTALAGLFAPHWRHPRAVLQTSPRHWFGGLAITLALALPIVLNTILNWPGEWPKYIDYGARASRTLHHTVATAVGYMLRFWWPGGPLRGAHRLEQVTAAAVGLALIVLAFWLVRGCQRPGERRFMLWSLAVAIEVTVLFLYYAWHGIDEITSPYEGYFYWSAPLLVLLVMVVGAIERIQFAGESFVIPVLTVMTVVAAIAASKVPLRPDADGPGQYFGDPGMPHDVAVLRAASQGHEIVVEAGHVGWGDPVGVIAYADRIGLRACVQGKKWRILFRAQSVCTPAELRDGRAFVFRDPKHPIPGRRLLVMRSTVVYPVVQGLRKGKS